MNIAFQLVALPYEPFAPLFDQTDAELVAIGARRMVVDTKPGFPCRVSLADAEIGETVLALPFTHHDVRSPYRASGPIFVRRGTSMASPRVNEIPIMFAHRLLSIRGYDESAILTAAEVIHGKDLEGAIQRLFCDENVSYLHLHNAGPGCYNCSVRRA
jgi:hypothetical protein